MPHDNSVKDKVNLLTFNQWSGCDYTQDLTDFQVGNPGRIFTSTDHSVNGDYSLKLTPYLNTYSMAGISYTFESGKRYKLEVCCLNKVSGASIEIRTPDNTAVSKITLPVTNDFVDYSLELLSSGVEVQIVFRTYNSEDSLYVDNIRLTIL